MQFLLLLSTYKVELGEIVWDFILIFSFLRIRADQQCFSFSRFFSFNGKATIVPQNSDQKIGQRTHLSELDVQRLQRLYSCGENVGLNRSLVVVYVNMNNHLQ